MSIVVRTNLPDFKRQLDRIGQDFRRRAVRNALASMGRIFRDAAKAQAPVLRTPVERRVIGALRNNIIVKRSKFQKAGAERYYVGVRSGKQATRRTGGDPFYWRFLEGGWIPRGPGQKLKGGTRSRALQRSSLREGGANFVQYPFLKPAFDAQQQRALAAFEAAIDRAVKRYSKNK